MSTSLAEVPLRIAVVGPVYPLRGGIAHYTALLAAKLGQHHETRLYSFKKLYPDRLFPGRSQIDPSPKPLVDVEAHAWLVPWLPWTWRRVQQDWLNWRPDIVVLQWWVPFMAPMTAWLAGCAHRIDSRVVMICHNVLPHERNRFDSVLIRLALGRADRLIVHGETDRARAQALLPKSRINVVPHPIYSDLQSASWTRDRARSQIGLDGNILLFFGFVRPYKGLTDLLAAMPHILSKVDVTLLVVGEIWDKSGAYQMRVKELGLKHCVHFIDRYVPNDEVAMYFVAADLVALPYREATGSGVLQLAFGLGVPVVATRTGGMGEAVEDGVTGFLVEPGDIAGLSQAVVRFFREKWSSNFRENIQHAQNRFDWQNLCSVILSN